MNRETQKHIKEVLEDKGKLILIAVNTGDCTNDNTPTITIVKNKEYIDCEYDVRIVRNEYILTEEKDNDSIVFLVLKQLFPSITKALGFYNCYDNFWKTCQDNVEKNHWKLLDKNNLMAECSYYFLLKVSDKELKNFNNCIINDINIVTPE